MSIEWGNSMAAHLTRNFQVTIPQHNRDAVNLTSGWRIDYVIHSEGGAALKRIGA